MKPTSIILLAFCFSFFSSLAQNIPGKTHGHASITPQMYGTGNWNADSLGNHRAVIQVDEKAPIVWAHLPWRRRDSDPQQKDVIVVDAATGQMVNNVYRAKVNREFGDILFQPPSAGEYYVYYLDYYMHGRSSYPKVTYPEYVSRAEDNWLKKAQSAAGKLKKLSKAKLVQFQSIDQFNSFYPMEIIATEKEVNKLLKDNPESEYLLFPEIRENSIRMTTDIPLKWIQDGVTRRFSGKALKGEYFTFQVGLFAAQKDIENLEVEFSELKKEGRSTIDAGAFSSFNTGGINWKGEPFKKEVSVAIGKVQALWMGVQIPEDINAGVYEGFLQIKPANAAPQKVTIALEIADETIKAAGDDEPSRLSRLRWLNSTIASEDEIVPPYSALEIEANTIKCLGREVALSSGGFPESIKSYFSQSVTKIQDQALEILSAPIELVVETNQGSTTWTTQSHKMISQKEGAITWEVHSEMPGLKLNGTACMEFDGNIDYQLIFTATENIELKDIRLEIPLQPQAARYMMGLGEKGGFRPEKVDWKWATEKNQDGPWVGNVNAGLQARFRDNHYARPLNTNFYQQNPLYMPDSWDNNGKGGITITTENDQSVLINSYSGSRTVQKGEQLHYYFNLLITPFRPIDTKKHWHNRYYHSYQPIDKVIAYGANVINVHHANEINPFINYPFFRPDKMKAYIDEAHDKGLKVKIYYTVRELANRAPELFMLRSLGDEVLSYGKGGGFAWLQEHLDSNYIAAWFVPSLKDAAVINSGISRWHNFYIEGLNWLVQNIGIDGLYIDDLAFDRNSMKRIRRVLERGNPGALIDIHSANQFNPRDGFANSANLYLEHFPFIDRLWFGEYFDYAFPPDFWLIETSGIPFGLMGEMLQDGGNAWRGMVFGMTSRGAYSKANPVPIWKAWDDFGIEESEMIGYWDSACPVATNNENVKATVYAKDGEALIAIGNWNPGDTEIKLTIDWKKLGLNESSAQLIAPAIEDFQPAGKFDVHQPLKIPGGKGALLIVR